MRKTIVVLAMLALVVPALADTLTPEIARGQPIAQTGSPRGTVVYDCTTTRTGYGFAGNPGTWIGDDLIMTTGGILDDVSFSIYNSYNTGVNSSLDFVSSDLLFFDTTAGTYLGGVTFSNIDLFTANGGVPLAPGYAVLLHATGLSGLGINLTSSIIAVEVLYNQSSQGTFTGMGQLMFTPPTVGSSLDRFYLDNTVATPAGTNVGFYFFSGNPVANFYWEVGVVPEPASFGLLALGALALIRRR